MTNIGFENILAAFCAPVLLNKKVSNLVSVSKSDTPEISELIDAYNVKLSVHSIKIEKMCECSERVLILVYREDSLKDYLRQNEIRDILDSFGYEGLISLQSHLDLLKRRMNMKNFPHEIGIFLGYPISDVKGFIDNRGLNYEYCGYWKVYGDIKTAKEIFSMYDSLKALVIGELNSGRKLDTIVAQFQNINIA